MTDANLRLCASEKCDVPMQKSFNLKPLLPRDGEDSYYEGLGKKVKQRKRKIKAFAVHSPAQISSGEQCWGGARVNGLSSKPQENQEKFSDEYEEIQCLSLEDMKVYKKAVPKRMSPMKELWNISDFPGLQNLGPGKNVRETLLSCACRRRESNGSGNPSSRRVVDRVSTHCQTDEGQFRVDISSSTPDALLCRKIPTELRYTMMNIISQNRENLSVITLLSCLLYKFMINVLHKKETLDTLSASDLQDIESILSDEMKNLTSFSSRSVRGKSRFQSLNTCFGTLLSRFPALRTLPEFEDLSPSCQTHSCQ